MLMRQPDTTVGPFRDRDTVVLRATFKDDSDPAQPIPGAALDSATLTLYSEKPLANGTYQIINLRDHVDIRSFIDNAGRLVFPLAQADLAMVDTPLGPMEYHRALIEWVWNGNRRGSWEVRIVVRDVERVT